MNNAQYQEEHLAHLLVVTISDYVTEYLEEGDWDAAICAVLASALEIASGKKLKPLEQLWTFQNSSD